MKILRSRRISDHQIKKTIRKTMAEKKKKIMMDMISILKIVIKRRMINKSTNHPVILHYLNLQEKQQLIIKKRQVLLIMIWIWMMKTMKS